MNNPVIKSEVYCLVLFEATHCWPSCPIEEVSYLRYPHRHVFYIRAYKNVNHLDRETEFIYLKHKIEKYLTEKYPTRDLGSTSCEMLAKDLISQFDLTKADVSEDNENGSVLTVI